MSSLGFTSKEQRNLGLLVHLMTSNPKILYAPVGTEVDKVILKVRVQRPGLLSVLSCPSSPSSSSHAQAGSVGPEAAGCPGPWGSCLHDAGHPGKQGTSCLLPVCDLPPFQANETFAFVGNVTHYAKAWLNISPEIRAYLEEGRLQRRIRWLQQVGWCSGDSQAELGKWVRMGCPAPRHLIASSWSPEHHQSRCPPCSCEDQADSLVDAGVDAASPIPRSVGSCLCAHTKDRALRGRECPNVSLLCLCPSSLLTSTSTQRS